MPLPAIVPAGPPSVSIPAFSFPGLTVSPTDADESLYSHLGVIYVTYTHSAVLSEQQVSARLKIHNTGKVSPGAGMWPKHTESYRAHEAGHTQLVMRQQHMNVGDGWGGAKGPRLCGSPQRTLWPSALLLLQEQRLEGTVLDRTLHADQSRHIRS